MTKSTLIFKSFAMHPSLAGIISLLLASASMYRAAFVRSATVQPSSIDINEPVQADLQELPTRDVKNSGTLPGVKRIRPRVLPNMTSSWTDAGAEYNGSILPDFSYIDVLAPHHLARLYAHLQDTEDRIVASLNQSSTRQDRDSLTTNFNLLQRVEDDQIRMLGPGLGIW